MAKRTNEQILADDAHISELYLAGKTQKEMVKATGLSQPTISRALARVRDRWLQSQLVNFHEAKMRHLSQIAYVFEEAKEAWEASKEQKVTTSKSTRAVGGVAANVQASQRKEDSNGDPRFLKTMLECVRQEGEILGYKTFGDINVTENTNNILINADRMALVTQSAQKELEDWEAERFS
jgi:hypothetical protein